MTRTIATKRLSLRPLTEADAPAMFAWLGDPEVCRFLRASRFADADAVRVWIKRSGDAPGAVFGIERSADHRLVGSCAIHPVAETGEWTFGYSILRSEWGKGYATEAVRAMIDFAHAAWNACDFIAEHAADNPASGRVMEKCGMRFDHETTYSKNDGSRSFAARAYRLHLTKREHVSL